MMTLPFSMPDPFSFERRVVAHYFPSFPLSIDNKPAFTDYYNTQFLMPGGEGGKFSAVGGYLRARPLPVPVQATFSAVTNMEIEVKMAIMAGITGFAIDLTSFSDAIDPVGHLANMCIAAQNVNPRFWVIPMLDMSAMMVTQVQAAQLIAKYSDESLYPSIARLPDGRMLYSAFNATMQSLAWWEGVISILNGEEVDVAFLPVLLGSATSSVLDPIAIGTAGWGTATAAVALAPAGYMPPILSQQYRPKDAKFWEASNFDTFRNCWKSAIAGALAGVTQIAQAITWNDFSEGAQVQPFTDKSLALNIGTAFYDLTAYYATWFMSGVQPTITKDVLYWCYRKMPSNAAHANQQTGAAIVLPPVEEDNFEMLAFLTEPGTLIIDGQSMQAQAGITSFKVPAVPGNPVMALQRNGSDVHRGTCPIPYYGVVGSPDGIQDLTYWGGSL
jgi:hypothetical protein